MTRPLRSITLACALAITATACGIYANIGENGDDCELRPLEASPAALVIGIQKARASCASMVEVNGKPYSVGAGGWLDEHALELTRYAPISRANTIVAEPIAYALAGVDPTQFLVMRGDLADDAGASERYAVLWGEVADLPASVCQYADPAAPGYPGDACPLRTGRTYTAGMNTACGLDQPVGPYGGDYWTVIDPPGAPGEGDPYPGMYLGMDWGTVELVGPDRAVYRSERGGELELRRLGPVASIAPCPSPSF
jgi:hypothetical protein